MPMPRPLEAAVLRAVIDRARSTGHAGAPRPVAPLDAFAPGDIAMRLYREYVALVDAKGGRT
jgi:hypothetical protein